MRAIAVCVALLAGCATQQNFEKGLNSWMGANVNALISRFGPPERTFTLPNGDVMYSYTLNRGAAAFTSPSQTTVYGNTATTSPGFAFAGPLYCRVDFTIYREATVVAYRYEGNACKARE